MVERIIELSVRHKWVVFGAVLVLALFAADSARKTPLDALPDISDPQVIIFTEWMGRSPDLVEDQITYPLVRALQSTPGVRTVRGYSMFGMLVPRRPSRSAFRLPKRSADWRNSVRTKFVASRRPRLSRCWSVSLQAP